MADTPRADAPSKNIVQSDRVSSDAGAEGGMQIAGEAAFYEMDVCAAPADIALPDWNTEEYSALEEPGFKAVAMTALHIFSGRGHGILQQSAPND